MVIGIIVDIAQAIFGFRDRFKAQSRDKKDRLAVYFESIGVTLYDIGVCLHKKTVPSRSLGELQVHAEMLAEIVAPVMGEEKAKSLQRKKRKGQK